MPKEDPEGLPSTEQAIEINEEDLPDADESATAESGDETAVDPDVLCDLDELDDALWAGFE